MRIIACVRVLVEGVLAEQQYSATEGYMQRIILVLRMSYRDGMWNIACEKMADSFAVILQCF